MRFVTCRLPDGVEDPAILSAGRHTDLAAELAGPFL